MDSFQKLNGSEETDDEERKRNEKNRNKLFCNKFNYKRTWFETEEGENTFTLMLEDKSFEMSVQWENFKPLLCKTQFVLLLNTLN